MNKARSRKVPGLFYGRLNAVTDRSIAWLDARDLYDPVVLDHHDVCLTAKRRERFRADLFDEKAAAPIDLEIPHIAPLTVFRSQHFRIGTRLHQP